MLRNPNGLSYAVVSLLGVTVVVDVLSLIATFGVRADFQGDLADHPDPAGYGGDMGMAVAGIAQGMLLVATATVFIIWFHRLRQNAEVWAGDLQGRSTGWAIGAWFIPVANLVIPRGVAADIWRASRREPYAADGGGEFALLNGWWTLFVLDALVGRVASRMYDKADTVDGIVTATGWLMTSDLLNIAAAVLAILFVRKLTSMQHTKATGIIPAAQ
ncbi:DUF4328 domain-containing protein [Streptomyces sp. NPDC085481]|uniref:DUF4328 domain-containing protein n=1 Tax=Streptomyces sp. NPDC085481 TaxID=3365727 RepID=UPI0037D89E63